MCGAKGSSIYTRNSGTRVVDPVKNGRVMKAIPRSISLYRGLGVICLGVLLFAQTAGAGTSDLNITCVKKRFENIASDSSGKSMPGSHTSTKSERWGYTVTVENQGFKKFENLDIKYVVYFKHQELGIKGPPRKKTSGGTYKLETLGTFDKKSFDTSAVTLNFASLGDAYFFTNGAKINVKDALEGLWVRVYAGDNLISESTYPTDLANTEKWVDKNDSDDQEHPQ